MKLISVQSRGNRLVIVKQFEIFGCSFCLDRKEFFDGKREFVIREGGGLFELVGDALEAAETWLKGATV